MDEIVVGIDLGTTNSAIAVVSRAGRPEVIPNADGQKTTPSVVQIGKSAGIVVGDQAKQEIILEKENTAQFFKRDMGTSAVYEYQGHSYTPEDLSAEVLKQLRRDAEAYLGAPVRKAVITVPAYFQNSARLATQEAGRLAGLEVLQVINEPTAAALAYGLRQAQNRETILVYDLGGGTFDITLVEVDPDGLDVIGTDGDHFLGGKDWDDRLAQYLCEEFQRRQGIDPLEDAFTFQEILLRSEEAKKALSGRTVAMVSVNCQGRMERIEVTRDRFHELTRSLVYQTEALVQKVLSDTRRSMADVSSILMVGGSTRMPMCHELVQRLTGKLPNTQVNPDECVALGAAIHAAAITGRTGPTGLRLGPARVRDVMSHSMGMVALNSDRSRYLNSVLIAKNKSIPCTEVRPFQTPARKTCTTEVSVYVTQGEGDDLTNCSFVGKYVLAEIPAQPGPNAVIDIAYAYDTSGVINVTAVDRHTGALLTVQREPVPDDMSWVHLPPQAPPPIQHRTIYVAIDLSGSMAGEPLDKAKAAVRGFLSNSDLSHTSIGLIAFSDRVRVDAKASQDQRKLEQAVDDWSIGFRLGINNLADPFAEALDLLKDGPGHRLIVVLTDGVWANQQRAIERAGACHRIGIDVVAIGFGEADREFLRRIANTDEGAMFTTDLGGTLETIAQILVESNGTDLRSGLRRLTTS